MEKKKKGKLEIVNRRAEFEYHFVDTYEAGISLLGTEIKSIRAGNANIKDAFCFFENGELYLKNMYIKEYAFATYFNHEARRTRKLLLRRPELRKLEKRVKERGFTIVPFKVYISERGFLKVVIALAQGKKSFEKRESIKDKDNRRDMERLKKIKL